MKTRNTLLLSLIAVVMLFAMIFVLWPQPADAQCGSSASSCKTCHETQGADPVNTKGDWHTDHAFGDFCEFCHAGNVQATDKAGAHQGLASPLDDVAASCQSCHPQDMDERAAKYAATLGVDLSAGGSTETAPATGGDTGGDTGGAPVVAVNNVAPAGGLTPPLGGEEIDFDALYAEATAPRPLISNWGNIIVLMLIAAIAAAFLVTAWSWEDWGQVIAGWFTDNVKVVNDAIAISDGRAVQVVENPAVTLTELNVALRRRPELNDLWPILSHSDKETLDSLLTLLTDEEGPKLIHAISKLDLKLAKMVAGMDDHERELMLMLLKEMK